MTPRTPFHGHAVSFAVCLMVLPACGHDAGPKHLLRYAFEPGKVAHAVMTNRTTTKAKMGGELMESSIDMQMFLSSTVVEVRDGVAQLRLVIERMKVTTKGPGPAIDYDSDVEGSDPGPLKTTGSVIGKVMEMRVDMRGRVRDAKVPDELKAAANGFDFDQMSHQQFQLLPEEPVAIGATWQEEVSMSVGPMGKSKVRTKCELQKVEGGKATLGLEMQMDLGDTKMPGGMKMQIEQASGTSIIDLSGWLPEGTMDMVMTTKGANMEMRMEHKATTQPCEAPKKTKPK